VKIRTSGCQTLECVVAKLATQGVYGRLVHVGETFNSILWAVNCTKMFLAAGLHPDPPAGGAIALLQPPSHYKGKGRKWLGMGMGREGRY